LTEAIESVRVDPPHELQHVIVDPGSSDGSRAIIQRQYQRFHRVILEPDLGPGDGLNKGFAACSADILGFLNSDDFLLPGSLNEVCECFAAKPAADVLAGHALIVDEAGKVLRKSYSDRPSRRGLAYGTAVLVQPSTFFRAMCFERSRRFNVDNRCAWDGELFCDFLLRGARFEIVDKFWSAFRVHGESITGGARREREMAEYRARLVRELLARPWRPVDCYLAVGYRVVKYLRRPKALYERLRYGPIYGRARR
jgi:glycosyltransferase involved in cell wall biosynthesis